MTQRKKAKDIAEVAQRRESVADALIKDRLTVREAAERLGISIATVSRDYRALLREWQAGASDLVNIEVHRQLADLGRLEKRLWSELDSSEVPCLGEPITPDKAAGLLLRCWERRARLLGLDTEPKQMPKGYAHITVTYGSKDGDSQND